MDYEKLMRERNVKNAYARYNGIKVTAMSKGAATAEMSITDNMLNPYHIIHGGCLYTIADVAGGAAATSYGYKVTTVDSSFHYLRAGAGTTKLVATAREIKAGKTLLVFDISVMDQNGTLLAEGIFTYMSLGPLESSSESRASV